MKAIPIFEQMFPDCVAIFAFDQSSNHTSYAKDALVVSRMNLSSGGAQPKMHDTIMRNGVFQSMVLPNGEPKGIKLVLEERGLWVPGLVKICKKCKEKNYGQADCCASRILSSEPDFMEQKSLLEEIVEQAGHKIIFYPKYHCELNFIESFWGSAKQYARQNCNYSWTGLNQIVPDALDSVSVNKIRKFARRSYRYMSAYRLGLPCKAAIYAVKKYCSHRRVPENVLMDIDIMNI